MKKKLLALLLASSMALMNVAPAYGTDIFTDPDNVANEDVISVPEELDNNGEFNDTEDEFKMCIRDSSMLELDDEIIVNRLLRG